MMTLLEDICFFAQTHFRKSKYMAYKPLDHFIFVQNIGKRVYGIFTHRSWTLFVQECENDLHVLIVTQISLNILNWELSRGKDCNLTKYLDSLSFVLMTFVVVLVLIELLTLLYSCVIFQFLQEWVSDEQVWFLFCVELKLIIQCIHQTICL